MTTRSEEIMTEVLAEMKANDIEDTDMNRLAFLEGLRDGWNEDPTPEDFGESIEKTLYQLALIGQIAILEYRLTHFAQHGSTQGVES